MLQFRLRTLLLFTLAAALATWVFFALPNPIDVFMLSATIATLPGLIAAGIVYCRGYWRAFCIGTAAPMLFVIFRWAEVIWDPFTLVRNPSGYIAGFGRSFELKLWTLGALGVAAISGVLAVLIRYLVDCHDTEAQQDT